MQTFTGLEYLYIDIANQYGLDKENWDIRLDWVNQYMDDLENPTLIKDADSPIQYAKAVKVLRDTQAGVPTGHIMSLDATASGIQIMAVMIGCKKTARCVNVIDTGNRKDVYGDIAKQMNKLKKVNVSREEVKYPVMTVFYGSVNKPKELLGEDTKELAAFYNVLEKRLPGALELMDDMQSCWDPFALKHCWTMPDGHKVEAKVMEPVDTKIEVDEFDHAEFTHRAYVNMPSDYGVSLAANIIHSIDGWIVREMVRRADKAGFQLAAIHDSFWAHPNNMNQVRQFYIDIFVEMANSTMMQDILNELRGREKITYYKWSKKLAKHIRKSEYLLS